jgi:hypothetical protein
MICVEEEIAMPAKKYRPVATITSGPLNLPRNNKCKVFDIMGRTVNANHLAPGVYFVEIDGKIRQKVIKIQ